MLDDETTAVRFPVPITIDEWECIAIKSTTWLSPGIVVLTSLGRACVILEKDNRRRMLILQSLEDGALSTCPINDAKRWWKLVRGIRLKQFVKAYQKMEKMQIT